MVRAVMMAGLLSMISALPGAAQPAQVAPLSQSIGGGLQWALPYVQTARPGVQLSWRRWGSHSLGIGAELRWWGRQTTSEFNFPAQRGPEGVAVPASHGEEERRVSSYGLGVNVVGRSTIGRLSFVAGLGPGFFADRTSYDRRIDGRQLEGGSTVRSIGLHSLAEMNVQATSRMSVFAGVRIEVRDLRDSESLSGYPAAGLRCAF
jgi:hypothetical protein